MLATLKGCVCSGWAVCYDNDKITIQTSHSASEPQLIVVDRHTVVIIRWNLLVMVECGVYINSYTVCLVDTMFTVET